MDDFYSSDNKRGNANNDDGFFSNNAAPTPLDFYSTSTNNAPSSSRAAPATLQPLQSNPFESTGTTVDFEEEDARRANEFFGEPGAGGGGGGDGGGGGNAPNRPERVEGDDRYPWQIGYWMNLFNVDSKDIMVRVVASLVPLRRGFVDMVKVNPDLWAPFWICSTLVFFMTWTGNVAVYLNMAIQGAGDSYEPSVEKLPWGALATYGYWLVVPLVFWGIFRWKDVKIPLSLCYCIYGYSLFVYIPISIVATLALGPIQWLAWLLIMLACAWSTLILGGAFLFLVHDEQFKPGYIMVLVMMGLSVGLGLAFKLYFFTFVNLEQKYTTTIAVTNATSATLTTSTTAAATTTTPPPRLP